MQILRHLQRGRHAHTLGNSSVNVSTSILVPQKQSDAKETQVTYLGSRKNPYYSSLLNSKFMIEMVCDFEHTSSEAGIREDSLP